MRVRTSTYATGKPNNTVKNILTNVVTRLNCNACSTSGCLIKFHNNAGGSRIKRATKGIPRKRKKLPARTPTNILAGQRDQNFPMCDYPLQSAMDVRCEMLPIDNDKVVLLQYSLSVRREHEVYERLRV